MGGCPQSAKARVSVGAVDTVSRSTWSDSACNQQMSTLPCLSDTSFFSEVLQKAPGPGSARITGEARPAISSKGVSLQLLTNSPSLPSSFVPFTPQCSNDPLF